MSDYQEIIEDFAEAFDDMREDLLPEGIRCFLIKSKQHSGNKESVKEAVAGWFQQWNEYREQTQFNFATIEPEFINEISQCSFVAYGVPDEDNEIDIYAVSSDSRDKVAPDGTSPFWKLFATRIANERFTVV